jgi:hypothetical protein
VRVGERVIHFVTTVDFHISATAILSASTRIVHDSAGNLAEFGRGQFVPFGQFAAFALWDGRAGLRP